MAINFPNSPVEGTTYTYQGIAYVYKIVGGAGYWQANSPGNYGPAIGADVIAGTDTFKFVTPKAMEDSDYWNARNQGPGSGLDADTIDGVQLANLVREDFGSVITANHRIEAAAPNITFHETDQALDQKRWWLGVDGSQFALQTRSDANDWISTAFQLDRSGVLKLAGSPVWTSGNDGPGSGLNADTLDGIQGVDFSLVDTFKGFNTDGSHGSFTGDINTIQYNSIYGINAGNVTNEPSGITSWGFLHTMMPGFADYGTQLCYAMDSGDGEVYIRHYRAGVWYSWISIGKTTKAEIDALNVDADTLDAINSTQFLRSDVADIKTAGHLTFNDGVYCRFGNGNDTEMFFDSTHQYMDLSAGNYLIRDGATTRFTFTRTTGAFNATGAITGSNLSGTNTGDEVAASVSTAGVVEQLTQAEVDAGTDSSRYPTIAKLLGGFAVLKASNGYIKLPTWLGGITLQWGSASSVGTAANNATATLPIAFATAGLVGLSSIAGNGSTNNFTVQVGTLSTTTLQLTTLTDGVISNSVNVKWYAIGY